MILLKSTMIKVNVLNLQNKFAKFMYGRNGLDLFNKCVMVCYLLSTFGVIFAPNLEVAYIMLGLCALLAILFVYRALSKDLTQRRAENAVCLKLQYAMRKETRLLKNRWKDRKTHVYKKCPNCKAVLRSKRIKGTHTCKCPHCNTEVKVKVR